MLALTVRSVALVALSLGSAWAQAPAPAAGQPPAGGAPKPAWQTACQADAETLCKEEIKSGKVFECLGAKEAELTSEDCRSFVWKLKIAQTCAEDFDKYCKMPLPEGKTRGQCIKENEKNLSDKCRAALVKGSRRQKQEDKAAAKVEAAAEKPAAEAAKKPAKKTAKKK
jgi:hypothetical protein